MKRRSRKHPKPFCAYTMLARVFFFNKAQSYLAETILLANEERNFPEQPFHKTVITQLVLLKACPAQNGQNEKGC